MTVTVEPSVTTGPIAGQQQGLPRAGRCAGRASAVPAGQPVHRRPLRSLRHLRALHRPGRGDRSGGGPAAAAGGDPRPRHSAAARPRRRDHRRDGVHRRPRRPARRTGPRRGRPRPRGHPGQPQPPRERADDHRQGLRGQGQRQHRQLGGDVVDRRGGRQDGVGHPLGGRHHHGPVHREEHPRNPRVDPAQFAGPGRHGADLPGAGEGQGRPDRADLGDLPRHGDRAVRAGRGLHDRARRRVAAVRAADRQAGHRHRVPRRVDHGGVVPGASSGVVPVHQLCGALRHLRALRRHLLAGRRAAAGFDRRRQRRRAVRRAAHPGRADQDRESPWRTGDDRGPGAHPDAQDRRERAAGRGAVRGGPVLHAGPAGHRHRAGLRPHHVGDRRGHHRAGRHRDAVLRHPEGASGSAGPQGRQGRRDRLQDRRARGATWPRGIPAPRSATTR